MRNSELIMRIAAAVELVAVLFNLFMAFIWFISLIWVLIGLLWGLIALAAVVEACVAVFVIVRGYSPFALAGPILGMIVSVCNFNLFFGLGIEMIVLVLFIVAMVLRGQEDAAANAS